MTLVEYCERRMTGWREEAQRAVDPVVRARLMDRVSELEALHDILIGHCTAEEVLGLRRLHSVPPDAGER